MPAARRSIAFPPQVQSARTASQIHHDPDADSERDWPRCECRAPAGIDPALRCSSYETHAPAPATAKTNAAFPAVDKVGKKELPATPGQSPPPAASPYLPPQQNCRRTQRTLILRLPRAPPLPVTRIPATPAQHEQTPRQVQTVRPTDSSDTNQAGVITKHAPCAGELRPTAMLFPRPPGSQTPPHPPRPCQSEPRCHATRGNE